jgi:23S rRNA pseudouridine1911/1915/1917 synthase
MTTPDAKRDDTDLLTGGGSLDAEAIEAAYRDRDEDDDPLSVAFEIKHDISQRLDKYLTVRIPYMSRSGVKRLIDDDGVTLNGRVAKASSKVRAGDRVVLVVPRPPSRNIPEEDIPLDVLFEDEHMIVLNKQPGIIVHPARSEKSGTLINALAYHFSHRSSGRLSTVGEEFARPGVVHRLDRNTTGCIVAAKSEEAHWKLGRQFEARTPDKRYLAVVHGRVSPPADVIDLPIGQHPRRDKGYREKYVVRFDEAGKPSVTICRAREFYRGYSLVELELKTGRTHQIRVHLSYGDHPIVGDDMYGGRAVSLPDVTTHDVVIPEALEPEATVVMTRQALHAAMLTLDHPASGERMTFHAPLPDDMLRLVRLLRLSRDTTHRVAIQGASVDLDRAVPPLDSP